MGKSYAERKKRRSDPRENLAISRRILHASKCCARCLKEEEVWTAEYRNVQEARESIARWIAEYNYDRPHRGVGNRTPHEAFVSFAAVLKNEALTV